MEAAGQITKKVFEELKQAIKDEDFPFDWIVRRANNVVEYAQQERESLEKEAAARTRVDFTVTRKDQAIPSCGGDNHRSNAIAIRSSCLRLSEKQIC